VSQRQHDSPQDKTGLGQPEAAVAPEAAARELPTITFETSGCVMGHWKNVTLVVWGAQATVPLIAELTKLSEKVFEQYRMASAVHLAVNHARPPASDARAALEELTARYQNQLACAAILIEGSGFWASAIRSVLTGLEGVRRAPFKTQTFGRIDELARWLSRTHSAKTAETLEAADVEAAIVWMLEQPSVQ
jgi:hypothetical protein